MREKKRTWIIGIGLVSLLGALPWLLLRDDAGDVAAPPADPAIAAAASSTRQWTDVAPAPAPLPALPPPDAPLSETAATLQQLADAGHVEASCRLSLELIRCRQANPFLKIQGMQDTPSQRQLLEAEEQRLAAKGKLEEANVAAARLLAFTELENRCAALPAGLDDRAENYLRQAALGGAREARIRYAQGDHFNLHGNGFGQLLTPAFDQWRREAQVLARRGFENGEPAALLMVLADQRGNFTNFTLLEPASESRDLARYLLARRLFGDDPALARFARRTPADAALQRTAERQAEDWHVRYFKGASARLADHTRSVMPLFDSYCKTSAHDCLWPLPTAATVPDCGMVSP